jgi:hypothetical protein
VPGLMKANPLDFVNYPISHSLLSGLVGAPPPSAQAVAVGALGLWLFVPWAAWVDRHRALVGEVGEPLAG